MPDTVRSEQDFEVHDPDILAQARGVLNACQSGKGMQDAVLAAGKRNEHWRGEQCINLLAPEAPTRLQILWRASWWRNSRLTRS